VCVLVFTLAPRHTRSKSHANNKNGGEEKKRRRYKKYMRNSKPRIIVEKTEMKGTCHICGKNLASTHGFFIEASILKQLQTFFEFSETLNF